MRTPEETFRAMLDGAGRLQNGDRDQVDESRDYIDHLGLARATNTVDALCAQLTNA